MLTTSCECDYDCACDHCGKCEWSCDSDGPTESDLIRMDREWSVYKRLIANKPEAEVATIDRMLMSGRTIRVKLPDGSWFRLGPDLP